MQDENSRSDGPMPTPGSELPVSSPQSPASSFQLPASNRLDYVLALLTALLAFVLYLRTLAPGVLGGDSGEFQFAAWLGGFAHPTGYPLYLTLGWLWTHLLPLHDPAWRMNAFSALWAGFATGLVYLLALRMLAQATKNPWPRITALFAALTFAVTPTFWSQATVAEVYTLNAAFVAAILLGLVIWGQTGSRRALYLTALLYGLSLAHHRTTLLYLPVIVIFMWLAMRQQPTSPHIPTSPRLRVAVSPSVLFPVQIAQRGLSVGEAKLEAQIEQLLR